MKQAGFRRSRTLVKVARVLVEKRWQDRPADHDVGEAVRGDSAKPLAIALCALLVVRGVTRLIEAGDEAYAENGDRINGDPERKLELELCRHRRRIWIVIGIEIRKYA